SGYWHEGRMDQQVSFDYFFRSLPPHAGFAVAAGLDPFLDYLDHLRFEEDDIAYLRSLHIFDETFLGYLANFRPNFTVHAVPEGTPVFPYEPVLQVEGSIFEAQLIETACLNVLNYQILIATKSARICQAANGEPVMEFGLRRAHGPDGGVSGSRAAYVGGCASTSNVLAGKVYGIPVSGTHAHSWVMSYNSELEAFRAFARMYPERCVLLVDTYDTVRSGVPNAIRVFQEMKAEGINIRPAIRLDSGDLSKLSKIAWQMMTDAGLENPLIVASNDLEEDIIADLKRQGSKINAWGVGTHLITSRDCPSLGGVYKLVGVLENGAWEPRIKISSNIEKATDPGRKRVVRYFDREGHPVGDVMFMADEPLPEGETIIGRHRSRPHQELRLHGAHSSEVLTRTVFAGGKRTVPRATMREIRDRAQRLIGALPEEYKRLRNPEIYTVLLSPKMGQLKDELLLRQASA
ncbi:MAG: nicotinate phosphoribosyltransferase, partial [Candidatus Hydrogenedentes bacterium]|nr:nicotinate phosphoribosyltransferase [Candidatus Hydrogenedentota bacterium]